MSIKVRTFIFIFAILILCTIYLKATFMLPPIGEYLGPYGDEANQICLNQRRVTDIVTGINFDLRAIDTLGEEFILFASVIGSLILLRQEKNKKGNDFEDQSKKRTNLPDQSEAVKVWTFWMSGPIVLFGLYIITHGQLTPGGGFQGGVILATVPLIIYLAWSYKAFKAIVNQSWIEFLEAFGVMGFLIIGFFPLILNKKFLENFLPLGFLGSVFSGGTIPLISLTTGLEVAAGFVVLISAFLQKALDQDEPRIPGSQEDRKAHEED